MQTDLSWLVRLRWGAIAGQLVTIAAVHYWLRIQLPLGPLVGLVAVEAVTNLGCAPLARRFGRNETIVGGVLVLDVLLLTGLLYFTGGPSNPFSFLYLVYVALAAVVLRAPWIWAIVALSLACSGALFAEHIFLPLDHSDPRSHMMHMAMHLQGMWVALAVGALFIAFFVTRIRSALARREGELTEARARVARSERLASLATLAAGAAHELSTPLATIALVAREVDRRLTDDAAREDMRLVRQEVERCRAILQQLAADAGGVTGEGVVETTLGDLVHEARDGLSGVDVELPGETGATMLRVPLHALVQSVRSVLKNALEAAPPGAPVAVRAEAGDGWAQIEVRDRGAGMTRAVLDRVGEPFFTTKQPGSGMGLGLFLARLVVEGLGGRMEIDSAPGAGTLVMLRFPIEVRQ
jgi:two-component system sensor histidine kinase RegB